VRAWRSGELRCYLMPRTAVVLEVNRVIGDRPEDPCRERDELSQTAAILAAMKTVLELEAFHATCKETAGSFLTARPDSTAEELAVWLIERAPPGMPYELARAKARHVANSLVNPTRAPVTRSVR